MKHCPVCNTPVEDIYTGLCPNQVCTWEFEFSGAEPTPEMQKRYEEKTLRARAAYERVKQPPKDICIKETPTVQIEDDIFIDTRDGETYKTITIEDPLTGTKLFWIAENLRFKTEDCLVYDGNEKYAKKLGRLYSYEDAIKACPDGWRVPTLREWEILLDQSKKYSNDSLKSHYGWGNYDGKNEIGFMALPSGCFNFQGFILMGTQGYWWANYSDFLNRKCFFTISGLMEGGSFGYDDSKSMYISVRCVKDF